MKTTLNPVLLYLSRHLQAGLQSLGQLAQTPLTTWITLLVIGIAITLPLSLFAGVNDLKQLNFAWQNSAQISLYLKNNISNNQVQSLLTTLRHNRSINVLQYIPPSQGLAELGQEASFKEAIKMLPNNPLPGVIVLQPTHAQSPQALNALITQLQTIALVDQAKLDTGWIKRLYGFVAVGQRLIAAMAVLLGGGILLIVSHTIFLVAQRYGSEITIYQLAGATQAFIRRPFLYSGFWYGLGGGVIAWLLVDITLLWLKSPLMNLSQQYDNNSFIFHLLSLRLGLSAICISILLGLIGSWTAVQLFIAKRPAFSVYKSSTTFLPL